MGKQFSKYQVATALAILFHVIGLVGILFLDRSFFTRSTPFNLLLMFALLIWTQPGKNRSFWLFLAACFFTGIITEAVGVNTGLLFGNYAYGKVLGPQLMRVPLLLGVNWFIIMYCCGISVSALLMKIINGMPVAEEKVRPATLKALSIIVDGASLAVVFDWLMEPVAIKLNYWHWLGDGSIPFYNYLCWFLVSICLLTFFHFSRFEKKNKFAVNLLLVQLMFFLILRTFLK